MRTITERQLLLGKYCNSKERYVMCNLSNGKITVQFNVVNKADKVIETIEYPVKAIKTKPYFIGCDNEKHYLTATEAKNIKKMLSDWKRLNWNRIIN